MSENKVDICGLALTASGGVSTYMTISGAIRPISVHMNVRMSRPGASAHEYTNPDHTYLSQRMASPFSRMSVIHDINSHLCMENKTCCVHTSRCRASLIHVLRKRPNLVCPLGNTSLCTGYWLFTRNSWQVEFVELFNPGNFKAKGNLDSWTDLWCEG